MKPTNENSESKSRIATDGGTNEFPLSSFQKVQSDNESTVRDRVSGLLVEIRAIWEIAWSDWRTKVSLVILVLYGLMGTIGILLVPEPTLYPEAWIQPFTNWQYPLGTNGNGQSVFGAIVHASPSMYIMILSGGVFATFIGATVGIVSGYKRGAADRILMTLTDVAMTIPGLPLIIVLSAVFEPTHPVVIGILISINSWAGQARGIRSQVLTIRDESYVEASRFMGVNTRKILSKDITPQMMPLILIGFVDTSRQVIFSSVALYFLGVLPFEGLNWGVLMNLAYKAGSAQTPSQFHALLFPILAIVLLSWAMIMLVQGLDRVVNPRIRAKHKADETDQI